LSKYAKISVLSVFFILVLVSSISASAQNDEFTMAEKFYEEKDYESAIRMYRSLLNQGVVSANLYFNMGNACFKNGDLGHAVLYYLRAKRLAPDDRDIIDNLEFARKFARVQMEGVELNPIYTFFTSLVDSYRLDTLGWVTSVFFVLFVIVLCFRFGLGFNNFLLRFSMIATLVLFLGMASLSAFKYRITYLVPKAVIIVEQSEVLTGPSEQSDIEFEGAPGLVVEILSESADYYQVLFENKRRGWIKKEMVTVI